MKKNNIIIVDSIVIGSGISGVLTSLLLSKFNDVAVITKSTLLNSNSAMAQGGVACVIDKNDSIQTHINDTINTGHINNYDIVNNIISNAPNYINQFIQDYEIDFTKIENDSANDSFHLGLEGGHKHNRILHCEDQTGKEISKKLLKRCIITPKIRIFSKHTAVKLIIIQHKKIKRCTGVIVFDNNSNRFKLFFAKNIIIAAGGIGMVYSRTTNANIACGDGIVMAYEASASIKDMEFIQFHPTALSNQNGNKSILISEAFRGEGAKIKIKNNDKYEEFMHKYSDMRELAPRDIVSISIYKELQKYKESNIYLDITHRDKSFLKKRFPYIYDICKKRHIDISKDLIPVAPAAHYCCGGIITNLEGKTNINGLYVVGESACNGFHGANRLASNSLLEAIIVPNFLSNSIDRNNSIVDYLLENNINDSFCTSILEDFNYKINSNVVDDFIYDKKNEIRDLMWKNVGIIRSNSALVHVKNKINIIKEEIEEYNNIFNINIFELRNMIKLSEIIITSAYNRKKNIGSHYNIDYS